MGTPGSNLLLCLFKKLQKEKKSVGFKRTGNVNSCNKFNSHCNGSFGSLLQLTNWEVGEKIIMTKRTTETQQPPPATQALTGPEGCATSVSHPLKEHLPFLSPLAGRPGEAIFWMVHIQQHRDRTKAVHANIHTTLQLKSYCKWENAAISTFLG